MNNIKNYCFILFVVFILSGCATSKKTEFSVNVDSISEPILTKKNYILLPGNKNIDIGDLQFREFSTYINRALEKDGFVETSADDANTIIFLYYGIGKPEKTQYSYSIPVWGKTGISSKTTNTTSNTYGNINLYGNNANYNDRTNLNSTTTYTPTYGVTGYKNKTGTKVSYTRYIELHAIDFDKYRSTKKQKQLWNTSIISTGSSGDLRRVFPVLVAASKAYIAKNTNRKVKVMLSEDDKSVLEIKGIKKLKK